MRAFCHEVVMELSGDSPWSPQDTAGGEVGSLRSYGGDRELGGDLAALFLTGDQKLVRRYDRRGQWGASRCCSQRREEFYEDLRIFHRVEADHQLKADR